MIKAKKINKGIVTNIDIENGQRENTECYYIMLRAELSARALTMVGLDVLVETCFTPILTIKKIKFDI